MLEKIVVTILLPIVVWKIWDSMWADTVKLTARKGTRTNHPMIPIALGSLQVAMIVHILYRVWTRGG